MACWGPEIIRPYDDSATDIARREATFKSALVAADQTERTENLNRARAFCRASGDGVMFRSPLK